MEAFGGLFWRKTKEEVASELGIPPQSEHVISVAFSPIERYFYQKQYQQCRDDLQALLLKLGNRKLSHEDKVVVCLNVK